MKLDLRNWNDLGLFFPHLIAVGGEFVKHIDGDDVKCKLEESQELPAISFAVNTYEKSDRLNGAVFFFFFLKSNLVFEFFSRIFPWYSNCQWV